MTYRDGTILLCQPQGKPNLVQRAIQYFTQSPWTHAMIYFENSTYESDGKGAHSTCGLKPHQLALEPTRVLTADERGWMRTYLWFTTARRSKLLGWSYNVLKLLTLAVVYPTRAFWNWLHWVPFDTDAYGEICSAYVDEAWEMTDRDILPGQITGFTAPVDLLGAKGFRKVIGWNSQV